MRTRRPLRLSENRRPCEGVLAPAVGKKGIRLLCIEWNAGQSQPSITLARLWNKGSRTFCHKISAEIYLLLQQTKIACRPPKLLFPIQFLKRSLDALLLQQ